VTGAAGSTGYGAAVTERPHQLRCITVGDAADAWAAAGFAVGDDATLVLGATVIHCTGSGTGFEGWAIDGVEHPLDGLAHRPGPGSPPAGPGHPNGITRIDHVVVRTGDCSRTIEAFTAAGLEVRGGRSTTSYGAPMRQTFFWAGDVILELVGPDDGEPITDEVTSIFGLALVADDLDATAAHLGPLLGTPRDAVQPGRRIAGLRGGEVGIALPVAVMSPHLG
jgi:hypothetical protein